MVSEPSILGPHPIMPANSSSIDATYVSPEVMERQLAINNEKLKKELMISFQEMLHESLGQHQDSSLQESSGTVVPPVHTLHQPHRNTDNHRAPHFSHLKFPRYGGADGPTS
ncbi:hypothetical protein Dimus_026933 [Dionaea muscipula]